MKLKEKLSKKKYLSREGIAVIVVAVICFILVIAMYLYMDSYSYDTKANEVVINSEQQLPSFNKDNYK